MRRSVAIAALLLLAAGLAGCGQTLLTNSGGGEITAVWKGRVWNVNAKRYEHVKGIMSEVCKKQGLELNLSDKLEHEGAEEKLQELIDAIKPQGSLDGKALSQLIRDAAGLDTTANITQAITELFGFLPSHVITIHGHCQEPAITQPPS